MKFIKVFKESLELLRLYGKSINRNNHNNNYLDSCPENKDVALKQTKVIREIVCKMRIDQD